MKRGTGIVSVLAVMALLSSCGGGGGSSVPSSYTGLTTAAVITENNAEEIALAAFQGGDLGANTVIPLAPAGEAAVRQPAAGPTAIALVRTLSKTATTAVRPPGAAEGPSLRAPFTESGVLPDGLGGEARYTISGDDATGAFTGTFTFVNYHGDGGGALNGTVDVWGVVHSADWIDMHLDCQSVTIGDVTGSVSVTAIGTVDMVSGFHGGKSTLNIVFVDNVSRKTVWLSNYEIGVTDLGGTLDVRTFGRIYLHDYGYVNAWPDPPFLYPALATQPASGGVELTGSNNCRARFSVVDAATYRVELDADGNGSYEWSVTRAW